MNSSENRRTLFADDTPSIYEDFGKIDLNADVNLRPNRPRSRMRARSDLGESLNDSPADRHRK